MYKFLIVDDSLFTLALHEALVNAAGHQAIVVDNGPQALQLYQSLQPNIVLCDIMMPEMDGYEVFTELKVIDPKVILYFVTAEITTGVYQKAIAMNATGFFAKPLGINVIYQIASNYTQTT